jgi:putative ABC transport system permease protein
MNQLAFILAYRQLLKNKWYAVIKVGSLSIGFLFFIFIALYYQYEHSYEKWNPVHDKVVRVEYLFQDSSIREIPLTSFPLVTYLNEFIKEEVKKTTVVDALPLMEDFIISKEKNEASFYLKGVLHSDSNFLDVFRYAFVFGSRESALKIPNSIVITKSVSERLFGTTNPLGKKVYLNNEEPLSVGGVINTDNCPTHLKFEAITNSLKPDLRFTWRHFYCYYLLNENTNPKLLSDRLDVLMRNNYFFKEEMREAAGSNITINHVLRPIKDIHLNSHSLYEADTNANKIVLNLLLGIGTALMIITAINFFNLTVVQLTSRSKEIITDLLFNASKTKVYWRFIVETLLYVTVGLFITFILVEASASFWEKQFDVHLSLLAVKSPWRIILAVLFVIILLGIIGGIGPVYHLSKLPPSIVLKGNYSKSQLGKKFLNTLLVIQFSFAFMGIVSFFVILQQFNEVYFRPLGFNMYNVVCVKVHKTADEAVYKRLKKRLLEHPTIEAVSYNFIAPGEKKLSTPLINYKNRQIHSVTNYVTEDYEKVLQLHLKVGRFFSENLSNDSVKEVMVSEQCAKSNGLSGNYYAERATKDNPVIGEFQDFYQQAVMDGKLDLSLIRISGMMKGGKLMLRLKRLNDKSCAQHIEAVMREFEPNYQLSKSFLYIDYMDNYKDLAQLTQIFMYILLVSSILIIIGLFTVSTFIAQQRSKEIAMRLILGATSFQVITELNKRFLKIIAICFVISAPLIYMVLNYWLSHYAEHTTIGLTPFVLAALIVLTIAIAINAIVGNKVIHVKPIKSLRYE